MKNLYIHIPFCMRKCDYCAFYSVTENHLLYIDAYFDKLDHFLSHTDCCRFETVYIGGGTPTLLAADELARLFEILHKHLDISKIKEFSIESNPETLDVDKILLMQDNGVSRLSMGVQSFKENLRLTLGRHTSQKAIENAISMLTVNPFKHFNIDVIYGIPGETLDDFAADLNRINDAGCDHFSAYNLTVEEQTALAGTDIETDDDICCEMFEMAGGFKPFSRYEISNYAVSEDAECRHNKSVWQGDTLLGFGPSAASFDGMDRYIQTDDLKRFINGEAPEVDRISAQMRMMEIFTVNLRTCAGWTRRQWEKKFPFSWNMILKKSADVAKLYPGWLCIDEDRICLSKTGLLFWNEISMEFL